MKNIFTKHPILLTNLSILLILSKYELYKNYYKKTEHSKKGFIISFIIASILTVGFFIGAILLMESGKKIKN